MYKKLIILANFFIIVFCFFSCKKYPENTLWFKNPSNLPVMQGHITSYLVNGVDSLDLLNVYYTSVQPNAQYPYSKTNRDIRTETFTAIDKKGYWVIQSDLFYEWDFFTLKWNSDKKSVKFGGFTRLDYFNKNIFLTRSGDINWEIIYLQSNGNKTKIRTTYNNNIYDITFEK